MPLQSLFPTNAHVSARPAFPVDPRAAAARAPAREPAYAVSYLDSGRPFKHHFDSRAEVIAFMNRLGLPMVVQRTA